MYLSVLPTSPVDRRHQACCWLARRPSANPSWTEAASDSVRLRRAQLVGLEVDRIQKREVAGVIPDLVGKGNRVRTVTIPAAVKVRIDSWMAAAKINEGGKIFRPVNKATE